MNTVRRRGNGGLWWMLGLGLLFVLLRGCAVLLSWTPPPVVDDAGEELDFSRLAPAEPGDDFAAPPETRRIRLPGGGLVNEGYLAAQLRRERLTDSMNSYGWMVDGDLVATIAPGMDRRHHFANGYLVGYVPYPNVAPWVPLYALARNKAYQYDHEQPNGADEIWQTSREAFHYPTGDCEDHAIALADWLIGLGHDARVVIGSVQGGGHAWVVMLDGERTYLLEATDKTGRREQTLPLAQSLTEYRPEAMFNRDSYWVNTGSVMTTDYRGGAWVLRSNFERETAAAATADERPRPRRLPAREDAPPPPNQKAVRPRSPHK